MSDRAVVRGLFAILSLYLVIGILYAVNTPSWQVPDEPAHYNYIRHIAETGALPVLQVGDYDQAYLSTLTSQGFPPKLSIDSLEYEDYAPPLYYLLAAPIFLLFGGALLPLRLYSLGLGAGVLVFAFLAVRELFPSQSALALVTAGFIAFIPQHMAMMAGVNSDSLAEMLIAVGLWGILRERNRVGASWKLGLLIGLALITKATAYVLVPVAGLSLLLAWRRAGWKAWKEMLSRGLMVFGGALLVGLLWWGRNLAVYGWPDFLGAIRHDTVVQGQPRTSQWLAIYGPAEVARRFTGTTFQSFWGQFGWMGVVMDAWVYAALAIFSVWLALGGMIALARRPSLTSKQWDGLVLLAVSALLTLVVYLYYNLEFVQHQGRYLYPALIPIGLAAAVSLETWGRLLEKRSGRNVRWVVPFAALAGMAALDLFALYRFVIPGLTYG